MSLTGFSLVGGPAYNDANARRRKCSRELDVPYIAAQPLEFQTVEQWEASERGLSPVEATMMVAIPELDGADGADGVRRPLENAATGLRARHPAPRRAG